MKRATWAALVALLPLLTQAQHCMPTDPCWPTPSQVKNFVLSLSNATTVLTPGVDPDYLTSVVEMNGLKSAFPAHIIIPGSIPDLRKVVRFAAKHKIRVVAKCSGHDLNARSTGFGVIQINTQRMRGIKYDKATESFKLGAGETHAAVYQAADKLNRTVVGGHAKTVCLLGCSLGACHGILTRKHGLGLDQLLSLDMILYNGSVVTASRSSNTDLYNALLGSGQSTYGVITAYTVKAHVKPRYTTIVVAKWALPNTTEGLAQPNILSSFIFNTTWWNSWPATFGSNVDINGWLDPTEDQAQMSGFSQFTPTVYQLGSASYVNEYTTWFNQYNVISDWKTRFYNDYDALLKVKAKYDPCNLYVVEYGVGWDQPAATCNLRDTNKGRGKARL